jgi:hypothetical protein
MLRFFRRREGGVLRHGETEVYISETPLRISVVGGYATGSYAWEVCRTRVVG